MSIPTLSPVSRHRLATTAAGAVLLGCLALTGCQGGGPADAKAADGKPGSEQKAPDPVTVEAVPVSRSAIAASYTGTAPLEARAESQVVAKTSGVALQVMAEVGQEVRAGQVLVRLDSDRARLQAAQSAAQVSKLQANYNRSLQLSQQQLVSANDLDQLKFDLENARAVNRLANLEVSYANVTAPISGVIAERSIKQGNFVQINTPIFRIVDTSRLEATLNVPERELATLKAGQPVALMVDALPGRAFEGQFPAHTGREWKARQLIDLKRAGDRLRSGGVRQQRLLPARVLRQKGDDRRPSPHNRSPGDPHRSFRAFAQRLRGGARTRRQQGRWADGARTPRTISTRNRLRHGLGRRGCKSIRSAVRLVLVKFL